MNNLNILHIFFLGLILGWGAAIPIGPINLEITRRNLRFGTGYGIMFGIGACAADLTYLILLCSGALILLQHHLLLRIIGAIGSLILGWFGIQALRMHPSRERKIPTKKTFWQNGIEGYFLTLFNPFTVLFWASVSSQIAVATEAKTYAAVYAGLGVIIGTVSWVLFLNTLLQFTRHRLSETTIQGLNLIGGIILLIFAALGLYKSFF